MQQEFSEQDIDAMVIKSEQTGIEDLNPAYLRYGDVRRQCMGQGGVML